MRRDDLVARCGTNQVVFKVGSYYFRKQRKREMSEISPSSSAEDILGPPGTLVPQNPVRKHQALDIKPKAPRRQKKRRLSTDQIIALVLLGLVLIGILFLVLAFMGVFNETGPTVPLTPSLTAPLPKNLPVTVTVA